MAMCALTNRMSFGARFLTCLSRNVLSGSRHNPKMFLPSDPARNRQRKGRLRGSRGPDRLPTRVKVGDGGDLVSGHYLAAFRIRRSTCTPSAAH